MKKVIMILIFCLIPICTYALEVQDIIDSQINSSGIYKTNEQFEKIVDKNNDIIKNYNIIDTTKALAKGDFKWDIQSIFNKSMQFYFKQLFVYSRLMMELIVIAMLGAFIQNLQKSFDNKGVCDIAFFTCFCMICIIGVKAFTLAMQSGQEIIDDMIVFMSALIPTALTLIATSGGVISAAAFQPVIMLSVQVISLLIKNIIMPLILLSLVLKITDNISDDISVGKLANLLSSTAKWLICLMLTAFVGIISIQSIAVPAFDGITVKTAKFAVESFIPVVGGLLSQSVDLVLGCSIILKNALGIAGLIGICIICFVPIIKLFAQSTIFHIVGALIEPISDKRIVGLITSLAQSLTLVWVMVLTVTIMFIINLTIIIAAGNSAALLGR